MGGRLLTCSLSLPRPLLQPPPTVVERILQLAEYFAEAEDLYRYTDHHSNN